jgi:hypothetical protein
VHATSQPPQWSSLIVRVDARSAALGDRLFDAAIAANGERRARLEPCRAIRRARREIARERGESGSVRLRRYHPRAVSDQARNPWKIGCIVAAIVAVAGCLVCGAGMTYGGWSIAQNPEIRRGMAIAGTTMDMMQDAMQSPGAREMRQAGCVQAFVLTPEAMERFLREVAPDGGTSTTAPAHPMIFCNLAANPTDAPTCEAVFAAYVGAQATPPRETFVRVGVQGEQSPRCEGMYGPDGARIGDLAQEHQGTFGRIGASTTGGPPP